MLLIQNLLGQIGEVIRMGYDENQVIGTYPQQLVDKCLSALWRNVLQRITRDYNVEMIVREG